MNSLNDNWPNAFHFRMFLGTAEIVPDSTTIWKFRAPCRERKGQRSLGRAAKTALCYESQSEEGNHAKCIFYYIRSGHAKKDTPRGDEVKTWQSKDGAWAKKGAKSYLGMSFTVLWMKSRFDSKIEFMPANVHYSQVDLANEDEVRCADKGYFEADTKGHAAAMKKPRGTSP